MNKPGGSKRKAPIIEKKDKTTPDALPDAPSVRQPSILSDRVPVKKNKTIGGTRTTTTPDDVDLPPPAKKTKVTKPETKARSVSTVSPYLVEIERLKEQHIVEVKKLREEHKAQIEKYKDESQEMQHIAEVKNLKEDHQAEIEKFKEENEVLKYTIHAQKSEIKIQEHLVQIGAAVRGRWFELAKSSAGVGQPVAAIVEAGDRAIAQGNIRADLAMLQMGYTALPSIQACQSSIGISDADTKYKDGYFKELYASKFSQLADHLMDDFRSYPLKKLEICEMSATMTSLTGYSPVQKYEDKSPLDQFQTLASAADNEWENHICRLWPDHQRRLNTAHSWPPLEKIVRDMRSIVDQVVKGVPVNPPATPKSFLAKNTTANSPLSGSTNNVIPKSTCSTSVGPVVSTSATSNPPAPNTATSDTPDKTSSNSA